MDKEVKAALQFMAGFCAIFVIFMALISLITNFCINADLKRQIERKNAGISDTESK